MKALICTIPLLLLAASPASSQACEASIDTGVSIPQLIESVARRTGKKFVVDPRVRASIRLVGHDVTKVSWPDFLDILSVHGFVAFERDGLVRVVPDANVRQLPLPLSTGNEKYADAEFVSRVITVRNTPVAHLVPILRPLLPQFAHLAAMPCSNTLLMADSYGNVKRIEALVKELDKGTPYEPERCSTFVQREAPKEGTAKDAPGER